MDTNEKLTWSERVNHASEEQAKRTLNYMILKCNTKTDTIARAIRDAIERHTPTPTIVYQQPESEDDGEAELSSSRKKSSKKKKKKKEQDGSSQDEEDAPSTASKKRRSTRRGDINPDPLIEQLMLKKTKTKQKGNKKRSSDHDEEQTGPGASNKIKSKHASKPTAETKRRTCAESPGTPTRQRTPPVIDLVTSSDDDNCDNEQSKHGILGDMSSEDNSSDDDSPDDSSSDSHSSEDGDSEHETQGNALIDSISPAQEESNKKVNQASVRGDNTGQSTNTRSSTNFKAKVSSQTSGTETSVFGSGKKRKAPEHTVEEVQKDKRANSTTIDHLNKRSKQNHPHESQRSPEDRTCCKCGVLFPSVAQLLKHRLYCEDSIATLGNHHSSEPKSDDHSGQFQQAHKASHPTGDSFTDEPRNTMQLPSRPLQRTPTDRGLSVPPPSFVHEPNNFPRGPTPTPLAIARSVSGIQSSPTGMIHRSEPDLSLDHSTGHQSPAPKPMTHEQERYEEDRVLRRCMCCKKWFRNCDNSSGSCICHPGRYGPLRKRQMVPELFKGGIVPPLPVVAWTCCRRQDKDAPPCKNGRHERYYRPAE